MESEENRARPWRMTNRAWSLLIVLAVVAVCAFVATHQFQRSFERDQATIDKHVRDAAALAAKLNEIREGTRALIDPLELLLRTDQALIAAGLQPISGDEFVATLKAENQKLLDRGLGEYIDPCRQRREVEKHYLYEGLKPPQVELPGWDLPCD